MARLWPFGKKQDVEPRAAVQSDGGGVLITTSKELEDFLQSGQTTKSGVPMTPELAMQQGPVYACVRLLSGPPATLPFPFKRKVDERTRVEAPDVPANIVLNSRPNRWQKPHQFKRMMTAHVLLRGNGVALKVMSRGQLVELIPLHPDRVDIKQNDDLSLSFEYTRKNGGKTTFEQKEIFHLYGLTLNGYSGVTPLTYARETLGLAVSQENYGAGTFRNGIRASGVLTTEQKVSNEARKNLKDSLDEYRSGGDSEGKFLILEEGLAPTELKMTAQDAQWVDARKLSRSDIAMFFGVPPSMIGDNSGSDSNWGTGLEQKANGFVTFTLEDYLTMWEEGATLDLNSDPKIYAKFNRAALVKGDIKTRWDAYVKGLQWGVWSPNEVRALEDMNPRAGGDIYYPPPNTAGKEDGAKPEDKDDDPPNNA